MRRLMIAILLLFPVLTFGQVRTFRWNTELCRFSGTYDSKKYTKGAVRKYCAINASGRIWPRL
jgi:hypothetical protein